MIVDTQKYAVFGTVQRVYSRFTAIGKRCRRFLRIRRLYHRHSFICYSPYSSGIVSYEVIYRYILKIKFTLNHVVGILDASVTVVQVINPIFGGYPQVSPCVLNHSMYIIAQQVVACITAVKMHKIVSIVPVQTIACGYPNKTLRIAIYLVNHIARQSFIGRKILNFIK